MATGNADRFRRSRTLFNYSIGGSVAFVLLGVVLGGILQVLVPESTVRVVTVSFGLALALLTLAFATYVYRAVAVLGE